MSSRREGERKGSQKRIDFPTCISDTWWHIWGTMKRFKWNWYQIDSIAEIDTKDGTGEQNTLWKSQEAKGSRLQGKPWRDTREGTLRSRCEGNSTITVEKGLMLGGAEAGEHRKALCPKGISKPEDTWPRRWYVSLAFPSLGFIIGAVSWLWPKRGWVEVYCLVCLDFGLGSCCFQIGSHCVILSNLEL